MSINRYLIILWFISLTYPFLSFAKPGYSKDNQPIAANSISEYKQPIAASNTSEHKQNNNLIQAFGDSIRSEIYKNQRVIIYRVSAKETFYSIARKYKINPKTLIAFNDLQNLKTGVEIKIPRGSILKNSDRSDEVVSNETTDVSSNKNNMGSKPGTHTVAKGETLYSISRKYEMHVSELIKINQLEGKEIQLGQILKVNAKHTANAPAVTTEKQEGNVVSVITTEKQEAKPEQAVSKAKSASVAIPSKKIEIPATGLYSVQPHETLYSIGFRYGINLDLLRSLNNLQGDDIHSGQLLKLRSGAGEPESRIPGDTNKTVNNPTLPVSKKAETSNPDKNETVKKEEAIKKAENLAAAKKEEALNAAKKKSDSASQPQVAPKADVIFTPESAERNKHISREYREDGMGTWLNNADLNQARSVALHHTAPVGTILKVTNPSSRKSIFVKVVGNFQENADNKNAIVIISKSAADLIGAVNQNFRVELSYAY